MKGAGCAGSLDTMPRGRSSTGGTSPGCRPAMGGRRRVEGAITVSGMVELGLDTKIMTHLASPPSCYGVNGDGQISGAGRAHGTVCAMTDATHPTPPVSILRDAADTVA